MYMGMHGKVLSKLIYSSGQCEEGGEGAAAEAGSVKGEEPGRALVYHPLWREHLLQTENLQL